MCATRPQFTYNIPLRYCWISSPVRMMPMIAWAKFGSLEFPTRNITTNPATVNSTPTDCVCVCAYASSMLQLGGILASTIICILYWSEVKSRYIKQLLVTKFVHTAISYNDETCHGGGGWEKIPLLLPLCLELCYIHVSCTVHYHNTLIAAQSKTTCSHIPHTHGLIITWFLLLDVCVLKIL